LDAEDDRNAELEMQLEEQRAQSNNEWDEEMVPVPVNNEYLQQLLDMDFSDVRSRKGLVHGGSVEGAIAWISEHQDDPDIDQPYMVRKADTIPRVPLTAEQREQKVKELKDKIQKRRHDKAVAEKVNTYRSYSTSRYVYYLIHTNKCMLRWMYLYACYIIEGRRN
jgi:uncharacterized UBP type Zn finger protein